MKRFDLADPAQLRAVARVNRAGPRLRHDRSVVEAANALEGMANGVEALYRLETSDEWNEYLDAFLEVGSEAVDLIADAIKAVTVGAAIALVVIRLAHIAHQFRSPTSPPEPRTAAPAQWVRSHPILANAPPSPRVALFSEDVMAAAA